MPRVKPDPPDTTNTENLLAAYRREAEGLRRKLSAMSIEHARLRAEAGEEPRLIIAARHPFEGLVVGPPIAGVIKAAEENLASVSAEIARLELELGG